MHRSRKSAGSVGSQDILDLNVLHEMPYVKSATKKGTMKSNACQNQKKFSAATNQIEEPTFLATIGQSLSKATIKVQINKKQLQTLVDTGSSENFIY